MGVFSALPEFYSNETSFPFPKERGLIHWFCAFFIDNNYLLFYYKLENWELHNLNPQSILKLKLKHKIFSIKNYINLRALLLFLAFVYAAVFI